MAAVVPNVEEQRILEDYLRDGVLVRLYSNDVTPSETSTVASFTEVAGGGYEFQSVNSLAWVYTQGNPTEATAPQVEFIFTGATTAPGTIYGYYLVSPVTGLLLAAERFAGSVLPYVPVAGSRIRLNPVVQAS